MHYHIQLQFTSIGNCNIHVSKTHKYFFIHVIMRHNPLICVAAGYTPSFRMDGVRTLALSLSLSLDEDDISRPCSRVSTTHLFSQSHMGYIPYMWCCRSSLSDREERFIAWQQNGEATKIAIQHGWKATDANKFEAYVFWKEIWGICRSAQLGS
jgi:hypothetical protein